jgi:hypothetical protein
MKNSKKYEVSASFTDFDRWESPIKRIESELMTKIERDAENNLICSVNQSIGYEVDKDELIKALNYDRDQYNKGYKNASRRYNKDLMKATTYIELLIDKIEHLNSHAVCHIHEDIPKEIYEFLEKEN